MVEKFNRSGAKALLRKGVTKVLLCKLLQVSRPWLNELLTTRDMMQHPAVTKDMNARIAKMLAHLAKAAR